MSLKNLKEWKQNAIKVCPTIRHHVFRKNLVVETQLMVIKVILQAGNNLKRLLVEGSENELLEFIPKFKKSPEIAKIKKSIIEKIEKGMDQLLGYKREAFTKPYGVGQIKSFSKSKEEAADIFLKFIIDSNFKILSEKSNRGLLDISVKRWVEILND